jgi:hypothetical protein
MACTDNNNDFKKKIFLTNESNKHVISSFGNRQLLQEGASKPWPEIFKEITGTSKMNASAILEYFKPLIKWLDEQNKGNIVANVFFFTLPILLRMCA